MSQSGILDVESSNPQIPTQFDTQDGNSAIPVLNVLNIDGVTIANGTFSEPLWTTASGNTVNVNVQVGSAIPAAPADKFDAGIVSFDSSSFSVDANGFVTLIGSSAAIDSIALQSGTSPIVPTAGGLINFNGSVVAAGTIPVQTNGIDANTMDLEIQVSQDIAASNINNVGLAAFDSSAFNVDPNGFVTIIGGTASTSFDIQANTAPGTDPVVPTALGVVTVNGAAVANHSVVLESRSRAANAYNLEIQYATSAAVTDATKSGVAHFDSTDFTVDANGFVALAGGGAGQTITGDSGGALIPTLGNWNILGLSGSKTSGAASTLTIKSPPYSDQGGSTTVTLNSGSFATGAITLTTPATAGLADGDLLEFVATNGILTIQLAATQVAHIGTIATSVAGTITGTNTGDSLSLRYQASTNDWWATSVIGTWVLA